MVTRAAAMPGAGPGQLVRIAVPGRERVTASVTHVTDTWLSLRLVGYGAPAAKDLHGARATVEYIAHDGMHRLMGDLEEAHGPSTSALRFVLRSGPQFLGRRRHTRTALAAPVVLTNERTAQKFRGRSVNVSEGGILVADLDAGLPGVGARLKFALAPRNSRDPIVGTGVVTRVDHATGRLALSFEQLPRWTADELARVVFEHEQSSRARSR
jgi:PilZ domain-containing protein